MTSKDNRTYCGWCKRRVRKLYYAKKLVNMMKEDPFMDNAATDKEKEIVKKIRGDK